MPQIDRKTGLKLCPACSQRKTAEHFGAKADRVDGLQPQCKQCRSEINSTRYRPVWQNAYLKRRYDLTLDGYQARLDAQSGACAICKLPTERTLHVDHDHTCCATKAKSCGRCVRGLLCDSCNTGLGAFKDTPDLLQAAIDYLAFWTSEHSTSTSV